MSGSPNWPRNALIVCGASISASEFFAMPTPFKHYLKIKNRYCLAYFGHNKDYLIQLKLLRPSFESQLPGLEMYIAHLDPYHYLFKNSPRTLGSSELNNRINDFAYLREIKCDLIHHPVLSLIEESQLIVPNLHVKEPTASRKCVIAKTGILPTQSLTQTEIDRLKKLFSTYEIHIDGDVADARLVVGVEGESLFKAAEMGIKCKLVDTGLGAKLFSGMYPNFEVIQREKLN